MTWTIGGITLPIGPKTVELTTNATPKEINIPGDTPILLVIGKGAITLRISGTIVEDGKTASNLETSYLIPLLDLVGTQVSVSGPDSRHDYDNWILVKYTYREEGGFTTKFDFDMELVRGSNQVVV